MAQPSTQCLKSPPESSVLPPRALPLLGDSVAIDLEEGTKRGKRKGMQYEPKSRHLISLQRWSREDEIQECCSTLSTTPDLLMFIPHGQQGAELPLQRWPRITHEASCCRGFYHAKHN